MNDLKNINDVEHILQHDESRLLEVKKTTGELTAGMCSGCAFLNTEGGWLFFGIHPRTLKIIGQNVSDHTRQEIAREMRKFSPAIDLSAQYIDIPDRPGQQVIAIWFPAPAEGSAPYTYDSRPYYKVENTTAIMPRELFDDRIEFMNPGAFPAGTTPDDFLRRPHSEPINATIANALFKSGKTEGWGRGILGIFTYCKDAGLPEPEYVTVQNFVCLTIRFKKTIRPYIENDKLNDNINEEINEEIKRNINNKINSKLQKNHDKINEEINDKIKNDLFSPFITSLYFMIKQYPGIRRNELAKKTRKSLSTIDRILIELQKYNLIEHKGSRKTGGYYAK